MTGEMSQPTLQIFFIRDGELARTEVFAEGLYTMGRSADADLRLDVAGVEPLHALLEFKSGAVRITAHAASSGVEVNGERSPSSMR
jgi:pSer/pThr/pTyr-binding forkhead associated (FHA) protein